MPEVTALIPIFIENLGNPKVSKLFLSTYRVLVFNYLQKFYTTLIMKQRSNKLFEFLEFSI